VRTIAKRLRRLEDQLGPADGKPRFLLVVCNAGWGLALDRDTCIQVLDELRRAPELTHLYFLKMTQAGCSAVAEANARDGGAREIPTAGSVTVLIRS